MKSHLYFIAILPPPEISDQITRWKEEMASKFEAKHALKSPPHITLQMPFKRNEEVEHELIDKLKVFADQHTFIDLQLLGFGSFPPRVIYVDVAHPAPIIRRFEVLQIYLRDELNFSNKDLTHKFHPHITLATRDLRKKIFPKAWLEFKDREYEAEFQSRDVALLKHNGRNWEVFRTFDWSGKPDDHDLV